MTFAMNSYQIEKLSDFATISFQCDLKKSPRIFLKKHLKSTSTRSWAMASRSFVIADGSITVTVRPKTGTLAAGQFGYKKIRNTCQKNGQQKWIHTILIIYNLIIISACYLYIKWGHLLCIHCWFNYIYHLPYYCGFLLPSIFWFADFLISFSNIKNTQGSN